MAYWVNGTCFFFVLFGLGMEDGVAVALLTATKKNNMTLYPWTWDCHFMDDWGDFWGARVETSEKLVWNRLTRPTRRVWIWGREAAKTRHDFFIWNWGKTSDFDIRKTMLEFSSLCPFGTIYMTKSFSLLATDWIMVLSWTGHRTWPSGSHFSHSRGIQSLGYFNLDQAKAPGLDFNQRNVGN